MNTLPSHRDLAPEDRIVPGVSASAARLVWHMVWGGLDRRAAAARIGVREHSAYKMLRRAPGRALYLAELDSLRLSEKAKSIYALADVRDHASNAMARVAASKTLLGASDDAPSPVGRAIAPGFVIQIIGEPAPRVIDVDRSAGFEIEPAAT